MFLVIIIDSDGCSGCVTAGNANVKQLMQNEQVCRCMFLIIIIIIDSDRCSGCVTVGNTSNK